MSDQIHTGSTNADRMSIVIFLIIFSLGTCRAVMWEAERVADQCQKAIKKVILEDRETIVDDTSTRLHSTWLSQECEVRAGPEYVIRKYTFYENGTFLLLRYHYAEESCSVATYTVVTRGSIELSVPSILTVGATESKYRLEAVHIVPLNRQVAHKFSHKLNTICGPQPKWRPHVAQPVYERLPRRFESPSWYGPRYNSLQSYSSSRRHDVIDCLEPLDIEFRELKLLRVQKKPSRSRSYIHSLVHNATVELALGNLPPNVRSRWNHRPTFLQPTALLRIDTISDCPICGTVSRGTEYNPPLLHEAAALPALLGGSWISSSCTSVAGGLWSRRYLDIYSGDKLWTGRWNYYEDARCSVLLYTVNAAGSYIQRTNRQYRYKESVTNFESTLDHSIGQYRARAKRSLDDDTYQHLLRNAHPSMAESFAAMLKGNQKHEDGAQRVQISRLPTGTTELDLHVAESILIPSNSAILRRCSSGIEDDDNKNIHLSSWSRNCVPLAVEAPSTIALRARIGVSWAGHYTLSLGQRDDNIWEAPLRQCGLITPHNPKLRTYLRRSLGLRYGLVSSSVAAVAYLSMTLLILLIVQIGLDRLYPIIR